MQVSEVRERMGSEATELEAYWMREMLIIHGVEATDKVEEAKWLGWCDLAVHLAKTHGAEGWRPWETRESAGT